MAITIQQARLGFARFGKQYPQAVIAGMRAGLLLAMKDAKFKYIGARGVRGGIRLRNRSGKLRDSIRLLEPKQRGPYFEGGLIAGGPKVPYARIHELGGTTHPRVTAKMRRFAWYKYRDTGEPMWKGIALTKKTRLTVHIPQRRYLKPAIQINLKQIEKQIAVMFEVLAARHLR